MVFLSVHSVSECLPCAVDRPAARCRRDGLELSNVLTPDEGHHRLVWQEPGYMHTRHELEVASFLFFGAKLPDGGAGNCLIFDLRRNATVVQYIQTLHVAGLTRVEIVQIYPDSTRGRCHSCRNRSRMA